MSVALSITPCPVGAAFVPPDKSILPDTKAAFATALANRLFTVAAEKALPVKLFFPPFDGSHSGRERVVKLAFPVISTENPSATPTVINEAMLIDVSKGLLDMFRVESIEANKGAETDVRELLLLIERPLYLVESKPILLRMEVKFGKSIESKLGVSVIWNPASV